MISKLSIDAFGGIVTELLHPWYAHFGAEVHENLQCQQVAVHIMTVPVTWKVTKSPSYTS